MARRLLQHIYLLFLFSGAACAKAGSGEAGGSQALEVERQILLMGTRASIRLYAVERRSGLAQVEALIRILEETEAQWSNWKPESRISRLNRNPIGLPFRLEPAECRLFETLFRWNQLSGGTFDPAVVPLIEAWGIHEEGRIPAASELKEAKARSGLKLFDFKPNLCRITRLQESSLDSGAFGKGEGLDRALRYSRGHNLDPWLIDLGGQVLVFKAPPGEQEWEVAVASPVERNRPVAYLRLRSGSLATSGSSERDLEINGRRVGHILDPRSGRPAAYRGSVLVWHEQALTADILSTALYVMGPEEGLRWAEQRELAVCFLPAREDSGKPRASRAFRKHFPQFH